MLSIAGALLILQSVYLGLTASPTLFYVGNVFLHTFGGLLLTVFFTWAALRGIQSARRVGGASAPIGALALGMFLLSVAAAIALIIVHNTRPNYWILVVHIALACAAVALTLLALSLHRRRVMAGAPAAAPVHAAQTSSNEVLRVLGGATTLAALVVGAVPLFGSYLERPSGRITNPTEPPLVMEDEAMGGASGPFFPSSSTTSTGGRIPSNFFMTAEACARCHADIYKAWKGSAHHFSSFNNQWYRASIEYMQSVNSVQASKWCAGCHDHAVIFNGMMESPLSSFIQTQEAHTGVSCNSCHAITGVKGSMGQGGFHIEYPPLHDMAVSENPALRWMHDFAVQLDAGPHRRVFLKPFHREQTAEFCSSCHKVHLDKPVNNYRWIRGFNEYDNWQASGVSGNGARSFYYPAASMDCADCHMPLVASKDKGNIDGHVHDHSFLAANTALPLANLDEGQLQRTIEFLQKKQVTVDVFAVGPARSYENATEQPPRRGEQPSMSTTFAVGEEAAPATGGAAARELEPVWAPLDAGDFAVTRGRDARVDVAVRTRGVGHFFPGGTVDAHEVWLELRAKDDTGRTIYWSGVVTDGGRGPVDEGAQFYRAHMVDGHGNPIVRRNAWAARAVAWVNLIPPGAADVVHFRLSVPPDCGDKIALEARLNYRKFTHANTQFSFAERPADGEPAPGPGQDRVTPHYDDRIFVKSEVPEHVSADVREIPDLPAVVMSVATATLRVTDEPMEKVNAPLGAPRSEDWMRWNDYGIGLLAQGDLQGARRAFLRTVEANPGYADGYVNLARASIREGVLDDAQANLEKALARDGKLGAAHFFMGVVLKEEGDYDGSLSHLRQAAERYPKDRVVRNTMGRVLFLKRDYETAIAELRQVIGIDPEDLAAHYNLMLCYKGLGKSEEAAVEEKLYLRFKADEDANAILGPYLQEHPEDNRMRQPIHEQRSVSPEVIAREVAIRERDGELYAVLPGQAAEYAKRVIERGRGLIAQGKGSARYKGPIEAGEVRPIAFEDIASQKAAAGTP